ncbi:MAG: NeuD/PglB/VioB family sugar acetyltransferase [Saccharofermentanales bacterium]
MRLAIYGAGGLGRKFFDFASRLQEYSPRWKSILFVDDGDPSQLREGIQAISFDETKEIYSHDDLEFIIGQGEPSLRELLSERVQEAGYRLATLIHPQADVSLGATIEQGVVINSDKVTIATGSVISKNVLVQSFVSIGHDSVIGENAVISSFAAIGGNCTIGRNVFIGMQTAIRENIRIGDNCIIGMGAIVIRDIPDFHTVINKTSMVLPHEPGAKVFK